MTELPYIIPVEEPRRSLNPRKIRPKGNRAIILAEPRRALTASGLIIPMETQAEKLTKSAGFIIRLGETLKTKAMGLEEGQRVVYRDYVKYAVRLPVDEHWEDGSEKVYCYINVDDIEMVVDSSVDLWVLTWKEHP